jgi:hypothetical protein
MANGSSYTSKTISREPINSRPLIPARASREWQAVMVEGEEPETDQLHLNRSKTLDAVRSVRRERTPLRFTPAPSHTRSHTRSTRALTNFVILLLLLLILALSFTSLSRDPQASIYWPGESGQSGFLLVEQPGRLSVGHPEAHPLHLAGNLPNPNFGPKIEGFASYVGQSLCDPVAKPGVIAFRDMFLNAFPGTSSDGITRACSIGGQSEHKEGRAWDWAVSALDPSGVAKVNQAFAWLFATDKYGNQDAMIRRLGIMYIVWNHHIWSASIPTDGWLPYNGPNPHTDHVHFSFSWDGANQKTSFWYPSNSF